MIENLKPFYRGNRIEIEDEATQHALYAEAHKKLRELKSSRNLRIHTPELLQLRNEIQTEYRAKGLLLDLYHIPVGIHSTNGNYYAMVLKHFLQKNGLTVLVSEEDYSLFGERRNKEDNHGLRTLREIFGTKIDSVLERNPRIQGGDPDVFAFSAKDPSHAWFVEAKGPNDAIRKNQEKMFRIIEETLCPVEVAWITA